jgi:hypothetical protein
MVIYLYSLLYLPIINKMPGAPNINIEINLKNQIINRNMDKYNNKIIYNPLIFIYISILRSIII